jgi:hypothetical protein
MSLCADLCSVLTADVGCSFDHCVAREFNVKLVVYLHFEKSSEVCNFNFEM